MSTNVQVAESQHSITAIITAYKRPQHLLRQYEAVINQSVPPSEVLVWRNPGSDGFDETVLGASRTLTSNWNYGVWGRFALALLANARFVCIFDDDTIPGKRWLENCVETMQRYRGLLGTRGLIFKSRNYLGGAREVGIYGPCDTAIKVDIVGHAWFFERDWLASAFWRSPRDLMADIRAGEDINFSYSLQKYLGLNTYVPPHPSGDKSLWGSIDPNLGNDSVSIFHTDGASNMCRCLERACADGFSLICQG